VAVPAAISCLEELLGPFTLVLSFHHWNFQFPQFYNRGGTMRWYQFGFVACAIAAGSAPRAAVFAANTPPLKLVQRIELSDIQTGEPEVSADQLAKT
jgi:hypothetical protein